MTQFRKILLAGTATFALMATPALAAGPLDSATGVVSGAASGSAGTDASGKGTSIGGALESSTSAGASIFTL